MTSEEVPQQINNKSDEMIAAIDMGSNSFHMVVGRLAHGEVRILDKLGVKVQLGAGLDADRQFTEEVQARALDCLRQFGQRIEGFGRSQVQVVGTNALRVAKNRRQFVQRAAEVLGYPVEIISGREEARLIYLGVSHTLADDTGKRLVIDIGGGSTEFIIGEKFEALALESLHMGCVSYQMQFFAGGDITKKGFGRAVKAASRELLPIKQAYRKIGWSSCVGASGSVKAIWLALQYMGLAEERFGLSELKSLRNRMLQIGNTDGLEVLGVSKDRLAIFPAGLAILYATFKILKIQSISYSSGALREGLLYDMLGRSAHEDVRERSTRSLQSRYEVDADQGIKVEQTAMKILQQVARDWELDLSHDAQLVHWASQIFEIGMTISHTQYHKHGSYLVMHSDLPGFSRLSQLHLATMVRTHRRKFPLDVFENMDPLEALRLKRLCVIFRLAVALNYSRQEVELEFSVSASASAGPEALSLSVTSGWVKKHSLTYSTLQLEQEYLRESGISFQIVVD